MSHSKRRLSRCITQTTADGFACRCPLLRGPEELLPLTKQPGHDGGTAILVAREARLNEQNARVLQGDEPRNRDSNTETDASCRV